MQPLQFCKLTTFDSWAIRAAITANAIPSLAIVMRFATRHAVSIVCTWILGCLGAICACDNGTQTIEQKATTKDWNPVPIKSEHGKTREFLSPIHMYKSVVRYRTSSGARAGHRHSTAVFSLCVSLLLAPARLPIRRMVAWKRAYVTECKMCDDA